MHADLFDPFVQQVPLSHATPNQPQMLDVLGLLLLRVFGASRYTHANAPRRALGAEAEIGNWSDAMHGLPDSGGCWKGRVRRSSWRIGAATTT